MMQGENLAIRLRDDGRGLATGRIQRIAVERGLIAPDAQLSATEIAQLVFRPGFSTATEVSEVSGRGVGMDAVKGFVESVGGNITLEIGKHSTATEFVPFETVLLLPGKYAVAPAIRLVQQTA
jgi:chemotaxis protein histidine kinase CheA